MVAVSDFMRAVQNQIAKWVPTDYHALGTDGFGFADTRPAARRYFHVDAQSVVVQALAALALVARGVFDSSDLTAFSESYSKPLDHEGMRENELVSQMQDQMESTLAELMRFIAERG